MPKFKVMVADDQGHTLYDEWIEATGAMEACAKAIMDDGRSDVAEDVKQAEGPRSRCSQLQRGVTAVRRRSE